MDIEIKLVVTTGERQVGRGNTGGGDKNFFFTMYSKSWSVKEKSINWISSKLKIFSLWKTPLRGLKKNNNKLQTRTKYFKTIYSTKGSYLEYTKNSYYSTADPIRKWAKDMKIHFTKLNIHMANKHMKSCSTSQPIKEMPIKATVKYHCTPLSLIMTVSKAGKDMKKTWPFIHYW